MKVAILFTGFQKFSLNIFVKIPVLETIFSIYTQKAFPSNSLDECIFEFGLETNLNLNLDIRRDTHPSWFKASTIQGKVV